MVYGVKKGTNFNCDEKQLFMQISGWNYISTAYAVHIHIHIVFGEISPTIPVGPFECERLYAFCESIGKCFHFRLNVFMSFSQLSSTVIASFDHLLTFSLSLSLSLFSPTIFAAYILRSFFYPVYGHHPLKLCVVMKRRNTFWMDLEMFPIRL